MQGSHVKRKTQRGSIRFTGSRPGSPFNLVDAALAYPLDPDEIAADILGIGTVAGAAEARVGMGVKKSGRTSGVTEGIVVATGVTAIVNYPGRGVALFRDQVATTAMAEAGDSGSLLLDELNRGTGLLFAGSPVLTLYNRILPVLRAFGVGFRAAGAAVDPADVPGSSGRSRREHREFPGGYGHVRSGRF